ncbi:hypothetical protein DPEC_G00085500 [Dallia pectoralis]|uniref:Uncharacterized protein n=1 Tax=Dallia pectoralis TaxID=75939 RepID=A0ACC2H0C8_DALPE|nr:hypothetical protein DPEC_G00085500 [Dallia pectoralis]
MDQKDTEMNEKGVTSSSSGVVVQVREKKGPLRAAIPYMPFPVAVICLFLNTFVPGLGTFVSAFTVLCGARTDLPDRHMCCVFWLNIAAAVIQIVTAIVMVGWIMSIFWGMDMVILATHLLWKCPQMFGSALQCFTVNGCRVSFPSLTPVKRIQVSDGYRDHGIPEQV